MNDEQYTLASAYLDGEITAEERRIAEADPEVMAEVERLRALTTDMRAVAPPDDSAREAAIAAAMAEFTATAPAPADSAPIPFRPRPSYAKYLGAAAAVVAVFGVGIVLTQADLGGDDDDAGEDLAAEIAEAPADDARTGAVTEAMNTGEDSGDSGAADEGGDADDAFADEVVEEEAGESTLEDAAADGDDGADVAAVADDAAEAADGAAAATAPPQAWIIPPDFDPEEPIADEPGLGIYGVYLLEERALNRLPPSPETSCGDPGEELLARAVVLDAPPSDADAETETDVFVGVVGDDATVIARDATDCEVVLTASLFQD